MVCRLKDIAEAMSISVNTVSRALNGKDCVSEELRAQIKAKAIELGYVTNINASALRTGQTKTIAIIYDNFFNPYYSVMTGILQRNLFKEGYCAFIVSEGIHPTINYDMAQRILARGVDGVISFVGPDSDARKLFETAQKPLLLLGRKPDCEGMDFIAPDDEAGARRATEFLLDMGHRDIVMFSAKQRHPCSVERTRGFCNALAERGLSGEDRIFYIGKDGENIGEITDAALASGKKFSAIFCFNDMMAFAAMRRLSRHGLRVPDDVSVIGYDYIESDLMLPVELTSVDTDKNKLAEIAVARIIDVLEKRNGCAYEMPMPVVAVGKTVKKV